MPVNQASHEFAGRLPGGTVDLRHTPEREELARELRTYFAALMTPERRVALRDPALGEGDFADGVAYKEIVRQLGADGWLALGWPVEYGGQGRGMLDQLVFMDEAAVAGVPIPFLTLNTVGPTIMRYGTDEQRAFFLPKIAAGELHFAIGYSEPGAGTDLASLTTRAVRDGDEYVVNGQKMWTSLIQYADYVWLACRTDPEAAKHRGLSVLVVPTSDPGFSWTPVRTVAGLTTSATYYRDIRVPAGMRVGDENAGWPLITNQLNHERVALTSSAPLRVALAEVRDWAATTKAPDGSRVLDAEWVQVHLARVHASTEVLRLMNLRVAWEADHGETLRPADASATKVYGTELATHAYRLLMEVMGPAGTVRDGSPGAVLRGRVERMHRASLVLTFGGGTNEIQRDIIAAAGLGLPVGRR
jgi:alkylation response protein AidB-like acyl-CoA dehydrogenase